jgi:RND family efflux transporter MFP subunit
MVQSADVKPVRFSTRQVHFGLMKKLLLPLAILGVCSAAAIWMVLQQPEPSVRNPTPPVLLVDVVRVKYSDVSLNVEASGTVTPRTATTLTSEVTGQIIEVSQQFVSGGFFASGDVLLRIDDRNYQAELKRAQSAVAAAETRVTQEQGQADYARRTEAMRPDQAATDLALRKPQLAEAKANLEFAIADLKKRQGDLDRTVIRAPYNGMIKTKLADVGQFVSGGTRLAEVFAVDAVEVRLPLPDRDLPFVDLEAAPEVRLSAELGEELQTWTGEIVRTEGVFDEKSRVLYAVARVEDPYNQLSARWPYPLRVGTFVNATITGRDVEDVVVLPRNVLRADNRVWTVGKNNELLPRQVSVLRADENHIYIDGGLEGVELVCLTTLENPLPGTVVRFAQAEDGGD